ncbi:MAG: CPBP family intramembrane metalloprotease [Gemmatimonadota bacterium]
MSRFLRENEVSAFLVLVIGLSWIPWYLGSPDVLTAIPSSLALVMAFAHGGKGAGMALIRSAVRWRVGWVWWAWACCGMLGIYLVGLGAFAVFGGTVPHFGVFRTEPLFAPVFLVIVFLPVNGPVGEELGWRGYLLPRLQDGWLGPLGASIVIGTVWGVWHLPVFFNDTSVQGSLGLGFLLPYIVGTVASSVIMSWLFNRTGGSVLVAGIIWHAATDFWGPLVLTDSLTGGAVAVGRGLYSAVLVILSLVAVVIAVATRGQLGYRPPSPDGATEMSPARLPLTRTARRRSPRPPGRS